MTDVRTSRLIGFKTAFHARDVTWPLAASRTVSSLWLVRLMT